MKMMNREKGFLVVMQYSNIAVGWKIEENGRERKVGEGKQVKGLYLLGRGRGRGREGKRIGEYVIRVK